MGTIGWLLSLVITACGTVEGAGTEPAPPGELGTPRTPARVLILGDSISIGYGPHVRELLAGEAEVFRPMRNERAAENCAGTNKGVANLDRWLAADGGGWDVIHFNFGLHDLKRVQPETGKNSNDPTHPHQADPERYGKQMRTIVALLQQTGARLVFATTTPVPSGGVRPHREPEDVVRYNTIATGIMKEHGIPVDDLFSFAAPRLDEIQRNVNVHFTPDGRKALAGQVAASIRDVLSRPRS